MNKIITKFINKIIIKIIVLFTNKCLALLWPRAKVAQVDGALSSALYLAPRPHFYILSTFQVFYFLLVNYRLLMKTTSLLNENNISGFAFKLDLDLNFCPRTSLVGSIEATHQRFLLFNLNYKIRGQVRFFCFFNSYFLFLRNYKNNMKSKSTGRSKIGLVTLSFYNF